MRAHKEETRGETPRAHNLCRTFSTCLSLLFISYHSLHPTKHLLYIYTRRWYGCLFISLVGQRQIFEFLPFLVFPMRRCRRLYAGTHKCTHGGVYPIPKVTSRPYVHTALWKKEKKYSCCQPVVQPQPYSRWLNSLSALGPHHRPNGKKTFF